MPDPVSEDLALAIEAARKGGEVVAQNFRLGQVSREMNVSPSYLSQVERGKIMASEKVKGKIAYFVYRKKKITGVNIRPQ